MKVQYCKLFYDAQVGAQVMLLRNLELDTASDAMLVNGSRGVITDFKSKKVGTGQLHLPR